MTLAQLVLLLDQHRETAGPSDRPLGAEQPVGSEVNGNAMGLAALAGLRIGG